MPATMPPPSSKSNLPWNASAGKPFQSAVDSTSSADALTPEELRTLMRIQRFSQWMDAQFSIPGIGVRFGLDSLLGLIPGVGDVATAGVSLWLLREAQQVGVGKRKLVKMSANIAVDVITGSIPLVGDVFDVYWKSNLRNAKIIQDHLLQRRTGRSSSSPLPDRHSTE